MKKYLPYIAGVLWLVALLQFVYSSSADREAASQGRDGSEAEEVSAETSFGASVIRAAAGEDGFSKSTCTVTFSGRVNDYLLVSEREELLSALAGELGITDCTEMTTTETDEGSITAFYREAVDGVVRFQFISQEQDVWHDVFRVDSYVTMTLVMDGDLTCALDYRDRFAEIAEEYDLLGTAFASFYGEYSRTLTYEEKCAIQEAVFTAAEATEMGGTRERYLFYEYGYTLEIDDYIMTNGLRTNFNLAFTDLEERGVSSIYIGVPYLNEDF